MNEVKAVNYEIPIDYEYIREVSDELTSVCLIPERWQGREFGSQGESDAADRLIELWEQNIGTAPDYPIDDPEIDANLEVLWDAFDDKLEIESEDDFELKINGNTIENDEYYPIPCLYLRYRNLQDEEYEVKETPTKWYDEYCDYSENQEGNELPDSMHFEIDYVSLNGASGVVGDLCYIEDYSGTPMEGDTGIHLIEIEQGASDDVFTEKVNTIMDNGGSGFIIMTTNPSFIDSKVTDLPGVAISRYDGERLKQCLAEYDEVYVSMGDDNTLVIDGIFNELGNYIYLIDYEQIRFRENPEKEAFPYEDNGRMFKIVNYVFDRSKERTGDGDLPTMDAFLFCDLHNEDYEEPTYRECVGAAPSSPTRTKPGAPLWPLFKRPGFCISGEKGNTITAEATVEVTLISSVKRNVESRNVIGTIPGSPGYENDVVIICGHYDSYRGQCAIDDSLGPAIAWGIAKYYKDNDLHPKYTIKCIAWGGEEYGCLGSNFYVWKHVIGRLFPEHIVAVINLDVLAMDTLEIPFTPWIWGKVGAVPWRIIEAALQKETYEENTPFVMELPSDYSRNNGVSPATDAESFKPYGLFNWPVADNIVCLERWMYENSSIWEEIWPGDLFADWGEHRSGPDYDYGDVSEKISVVDMRETANITLRLSKLFAKPSTVEFEDNSLSFSLQDLDQDTYSDSVAVSFNITTEMTCWGTVEACIYKAGVAQTKMEDLVLESIIQNETNPGTLTITLPPNATAGNCDIRVYLKDYCGNQDDFGNETLYLYPYSNPIADFTWECNESNKKMINFTDESLPSPNATLVSWNWSFGDGNYSEEQNCSYHYSSVGTFNITLTITDSANKTANVTKQVQTFNTKPIASFTESSTLVVTDTTIDFDSDSSDVDGTIINTTWYFGDGTKDYGDSVEHSYNTSGFYTITLGVIDNDYEATYLTKSQYILVADALVDDNFIDNSSAHKWDTIQEGIDDVDEGGIVYVFSGSYDPIEIEKPVSLYGENRETVIISGDDPGVKIQSNDVSFKGFTISGGTLGISLDGSYHCSIINCTVSGSDTGVKIFHGAEYNVITQTEISGSTYGVYVTDSSHNWIGSPCVYNPYPTDCTFTLNDYAVYLDDADNNFILGCDIQGTGIPGIDDPYEESVGIYLENSEENTISTCKIHDTSVGGIYLDDSARNKIEHCKITENYNGINFSSDDGSFDNLIVQNSIIENILFGIHLPAPPVNNHIYYNDFIKNGNGSQNQSYDAKGRGEGENLWSKEGNSTLTKEGPGEGNYWIDYEGEDNNQDGIGDTPYVLVGNDAEDCYPVMMSYNWCSDWE